VFEARRYQVTDNLNVMREKHRLRFGFDFNLTPARQKRESNIQGRYDFSSLANYQAGRINRYRQTLAAFDAGDLFYDASQRELGFYAQDRATFGSVTLDAGLRWDGQWNPESAESEPRGAGDGGDPGRPLDVAAAAGPGLVAGRPGRSVFRATAGIYAARTPANLFQRVFTDNGITTVALDSRVDRRS
jgi:hypothetical protein